MPHVELADMELLDGDRFQYGLCHGIVLLCWRVKRKTKRPSRAFPVDRGEGETFFVAHRVPVGFAPVIVIQGNQRRAAIDPDFNNAGRLHDECQARTWTENMFQRGGSGNLNSMVR